jgi:ribonuclease HI
LKKKQKYYVVWKGHNPGVYNTWDEAKMQIQGFENAMHKSFESLEEATLAYKQNPWTFMKSGGESTTKSTTTPKGLSIEELFKKNIISKNAIAVDAACAGNPGDVEYRGVDLTTGAELFRKGPYPQGTNNLGEFLALVHALAHCKQKGLYNKIIYSDSLTAISWVARKNVKTKLEKSSINEEIFDLTERALLWVKNNTIANKIIQWDTPSWGENPADFGRK